MCMKSIRFLATLPTRTAAILREFARQQEVDLSVVVQQAVTKMCDHHPSAEDIYYVRGETTGVQVSVSETTYQLLRLWEKQTGLSKSKLVAYALQQTIEKESIE